MRVEFPFDLSQELFYIEQVDLDLVNYDTCKGQGSYYWEDDYGGYRGPTHCRNCTKGKVKKTLP